MIEFIKYILTMSSAAELMSAYYTTGAPIVRHLWLNYPADLVVCYLTLVCRPDFKSCFVSSITFL